MIIIPSNVMASPSDPFFSNTVLLLKTVNVGGATNSAFFDDGPNKFVPTRNGDVTQGALSPYIPSGYWSAFFDGATDYLSTPNNAAFNLGAPSGNANDFTLEFWAFPTGTSIMAPFGTTYTSGTTSWAFFFNHTPTSGNVTGQVTFFMTDNFALTTDPGTLKLNQWNHVAATRSGTTVRLFVNGALASTSTTSINPASNGALYFGYDTALGRSYAGHLSNARIVKGSALYTTAFTPPTGPLTAVSGTTVLALQDNRFRDNSTNNFTLTRNGDVSVSRFAPFGVQVPVTTNLASTGSVAFDGSGDWLTVPSDTAFQFPGDFTVECWASSAQPGTSKGVWQQSSTAGGFAPTDQNSVGLNFNATGAFEIYAGNGSAQGGSWVSNAWYHLAVVRQSGTTRLYVNGVQVISRADTVNYTGTYIGIGSIYHTGTLTLNGFISNFRVLKGVAAYTAAFTPPTSPLTAITGTSLLTCQDAVTVTDASTNNFTVTRVGNAAASEVSPFKRATAQYGGSGYFDGTDDRLILASNPAFAFGTGDFCVEAWIYPTVLNSYNTIAATRPDSGGSADWNFGVSSGGSLFINHSGGNGPPFSAGGVVQVNRWQHVAWTRSGANCVLYVNGVSVTSTSSYSPNFTGSVLGIGSTPNSSFEQFTGYMANLRIVKGTAVYTGNFTPPTAPVTAISGTSLLLNFDNAGMWDATGGMNLATVGDTKTSTAVVKYTSTSKLFDGSGDYLSTPTNATLSFGGDFTVESWVYLTSLSNAYATIIGSNKASPSGPHLMILSTGKFRISNGSNFGIDSTTTAVTGQWYHVAASRSGSTMRLYVNGVQEATMTDTATYNFGENGSTRIGSNGWDGASSFLAGYLSDVRITRAARYTGNFTPPTTELPAR